VARYSFRTPQGKKESVPVITQYYPKQIVYPLAKVDRHIDRKLMHAAVTAFIGAVLSFIGLIHGTHLGWYVSPLVALGYVMFGLVCLALSRQTTPTSAS
jgi:hypothetical protein